MILLLPILIPMIFGISIRLFKNSSRNVKYILLLCGGVLHLLASVYLLIAGTTELSLLTLAPKLSITLSADALGKTFLIFTSACWFFIELYNYRYMSGEDERAEEPRFLLFLSLTLASMSGLFLSDNLITMYMFFELTTLCAVPLVLQYRTKESINAATKYLYYSVGGAFLGLLGIIALSTCAPDLSFMAGGVLTATGIAGKETLMLIMIFFSVLGLSSKAGLYPLHGWLPSAHPVAPSSASAALSGLITKTGVFATIRVIYYFVGPELIKGSWVQHTLLTLALITVLIGSAMGCRENDLKKRLAYSSVSQISYILLGIFMLTPYAFEGAMLQYFFHAAAKITLYLISGILIFKLDRRDVRELDGIGRALPITMICFTVASLSLIGIPLTGGFVSKWALASASVGAENGAFDIIIPIVLIISALLTAAYLMPIVIRAFMPGKDSSPLPREKESPFMLAGIVLLCAGLIICGTVPNAADAVVNVIKTALFGGI